MIVCLEVGEIFIEIGFVLFQDIAALFLGKTFQVTGFQQLNCTNPTMTYMNVIVYLDVKQSIKFC